MNVVTLQIILCIIAIIMLLIPGDSYTNQMSKRIWSFNLGMNLVLITIWFFPPHWIQERLDVRKNNKVIKEVLKDYEQNQLKEKTK